MLTVPSLLFFLSPTRVVLFFTVCDVDCPGTNPFCGYPFVGSCLINDGYDTYLSLLEDDDDDDVK